MIESALLPLLLPVLDHRHTDLQIQLHPDHELMLNHLLVFLVLIHAYCPPQDQDGL